MDKIGAVSRRINHIARGFIHIAHRHTRPADLECDLSPYLPGILKTARFGYDGKGQLPIQSTEDARRAFAALGSLPSVLEKRLELELELSVIVARTASGEVAVFPVAENHHSHGVLELSILPARIAPELSARAQRKAIHLAATMDYVGVLTVEFFVLLTGELIVNELAPRPHNSGHATIEACVTSQFEQQVRTLCGLPLGSPELVRSAVMVNLLGQLWGADGAPPDWEGVLQVPCAKLRLYGKELAWPGRKMGHYCVLAHEVEAALKEAAELRHRLAPPNDLISNGTAGSCRSAAGSEPG